MKVRGSGRERGDREEEGGGHESYSASDSVVGEVHLIEVGAYREGVFKGRIQVVVREIH